MLNGIIRLALRYRLLVIACSLIALVYGGYLTATLPIDVFPDLDRPRVVIMTECPGLAAEEVETLVTFPLEAGILGASGVQDVRSQSAAGLSVVYVEFDWDADIYRARQVVQERLTSVQQDLPANVRPQLAPTSSIMGQIMLVGMYRRPGPRGGDLVALGQTGYLVERILPREEKGKEELLVWNPRPRDNPQEWSAIKAEWQAVKGATPKGAHYEVTVKGVRHEVVFLPEPQRQLALRTTADWVIRPRLRKIPGIAQVTIMGGGRKQYQVLVDAHALNEYDVTLHEVEQALRDANPSASGGIALRGDQEMPIRILARPGPDPERVVQQIRQVPVKKNGKRTVLVEQVARVVEAAQFKRGDSSINGHAGVIFTVTKQPHADTRRLTTEVIAALRETEESLPADIVINADLFQMKGFIDRGIYNVGEALVIGAILVMIVLFLFLLNFRTTFISLAAIPLSLVITTLVFRLIGWLTGAQLSINVMTLGGIAVAMGELVDDAVVDVENIFRRLRENHASAHPRPALEVIYHASAEVRSAIVFGTVVVILVFLPLFALSGVEGRLFTPLGIAYIVSILASLLVSLTVTPVLASFLLPQSRAAHRREDSPFLRLLKKLATPLIRFSMARAAWLLAATWLLVGVAVWALNQLGADFLPPFDEGSVQVNAVLPSGSSLEASNELCLIIDKKFQAMQKTPQNPGGVLNHFSRRTGRAELDEHADPVNNTEYILSIDDKSGLSRDEVLKTILDELKDEIPGVSFEAEQPLAHLISHMLSGVTAQIAIKIYGDELDTLRGTAQQIKGAIEKVPGLTTPVIESQEQVQELHIRPRAEALALYGVSRGYVAEFLQTGMQGEVVSQVLEGQRRFDLMVRLDEPYRTDYSSLQRLRMHLPAGEGSVPLGAIADISEGVGPNQVYRENARRRLAIRCNAQGRDLASVVADIRQRVQDRVVLPEGYHVEYGGQFESQQRATWLISLLAGLSLLGMFVVLYMLFPSARVILQILNALPTAFIGGVAALAVTGQTLTVASMVGFISLGGIAVRNGILLVTHYFHLMKYEGEGFSKEMVLRGSLERLSPVLMTALTAGIALVPLVLGGQQPGREILYPVATVILGGLFTSTLCEFLIHPGLFWRFSGKDAQHLVRETEG